ncbi:MAG: NYN domain-containing protein [Desulfobulbaceae bacterium DB1]|nr:MAG: NYN domain-containing protein [Desulfobulbaceae bacterium DB1]
MLKTGIYVDAENIRLCGGYGMRYDVLVDLANSGDSIMLRANSYLAEDLERTKTDQEYRQKLYNYHDILRKCGFKIIKKYVQRYVDEDGTITTKANADMDLAIDAILQSRNLDRILLVTGDGDFLRLVSALQNKGCRVEVIGFHNVSTALKEEADFYLSGFLLPGLLPIQIDRESEDWQRGTVANYKADRGFGFMRYYRLVPDKGLESHTVFFHCSKSLYENEPQVFSNPNTIFEFQISPTTKDSNKLEAVHIRRLDEEIR